MLYAYARENKVTRISQQTTGHQEFIHYVSLLDFVLLSHQHPCFPLTPTPLSMFAYLSGQQAPTSVCGISHGGLSRSLLEDSRGSGGHAPGLVVSAVPIKTPQGCEHQLHGVKFHSSMRTSSQCVWTEWCSGIAVVITR